MAQSVAAYQAAIADLKEQRSAMIIQYANDDDSTTGADHPDVLALDAAIRDKQAQLRQAHPDAVRQGDDPAELLALRTQQVEEATAALGRIPTDDPRHAYFARQLVNWQADIARLSE